MLSVPAMQVYHSDRLSGEAARSEALSTPATAGALLGGIEAGGTKFICGLARDGVLLGERARIETTTPEATLGAVKAWFAAAQERHGPLDGLGIASFGPVDRDPSSPGWGSILPTPKPGWTGVPLATMLGEALGVPVGFDTDVNGAAMAEASVGGQRGLVVYITVGTGIGGGAVLDGVPLAGVRHAEMGHFYPPRHPDDLDYAGRCPFHGACLEGLASGPAILDRWGTSLSELPPEHPGHAIIAFYLAHLSVALMATLSPHRIAFGGGVLKTPGLIDAIRREAVTLNRGYLIEDSRLAEIIAPTCLEEDAGLYGAMLLARRALDGHRAAGQ